MPSLFASVDRVASGTVDRVYGEGWLLTPMRKGTDPNAPAVADPDREPKPFQGVFVQPYAGDLITPNAHDLRAQHRPGDSVARPAVDVDNRSGAFEFRKEDIIVRTDTGERFRVYETVPDVDGRRRVFLNGIA